MKNIYVTLIFCISILSLLLIGVYWHKHAAPQVSEIEHEWDEWELDETEPSPEPEIEIEPEIPDKPTTYVEALEIAEATGKRLFILFTSEGCRACDRLKQNALSDPQVQQLLENYVFFELDVRGPDAEIAQQLRVTVVPTYIIATHEKKVLNRAVGDRGPLAMRMFLR